MSEVWEQAAGQGGAVRVGQLEAGGMGDGLRRRRVAGGVLERAAPGVYRVGGAPRVWRQALWTAVLHAGPDAVASGRSAAALWGMRGFGPGPVEVMRPRARHHRAAVGVVRETTFLPLHHRVVRDGVPCLAVPRLVLDLCARLRRPEPAGRALDDALVDGLTSLAALRVVLAEAGRRGRGGTALLRRLLAERDEDFVPTESELEDLVVAVLTEAGVPLPDRQVGVGGDAPAGRADFVYRGTGLVIEAQSRRHHSSWSDQAADEVRRQRMVAAGLRVVGTTWQQLTRDPRPFVEAVRACLDHRLTA